MKIKGLFIMLLVVSIFSTQTVMASGSKLGTAGAIELTIPMGVRNVAMGSSNIANIKGIESMYWNPAGLALVSNLEAGFSYVNYFADMKISYFALGAQIGRLGAVGISLQAMNIGDINVTTIERPEGTGEVLNPNYITVGATFSRSFTDRIKFGLNGKLVSEKIGNMSASAVAFDFGLQYITPIGIHFGVVMRNIGTDIEFSGTAVEFDSSVPFANPNATTRKTALDMGAHELPASLNLGVSYNYEIGEIHGLNLCGLYGNNSANVDQINLGLEYGFDQLFFARVGYNMPIYPDDFPNKENQFGLTAGFGIQLLFQGRTIHVDYAYRDMDLFDANQYFGVSFGF